MANMSLIRRGWVWEVGGPAMIKPEFVLGAFNRRSFVDLGCFGFNVLVVRFGVISTW